MIELARTSVNIDVSVSEVFRYVTNLERYGDWFPGVISVKSANQNAHATVGKAYLETLRLPEGEMDIVIDVVKCQPDRLFMTHGNLDGILPQMTMTFSPHQDDRCQFTLQYHSRNPSLSETSDLVSALKTDISNRAKMGVERLKYQLETGCY